MNKIYKTKRNSLGESVVTSELATSKGKIASLVLLGAILAGNANAIETGMYTFDSDATTYSIGNSNSVQGKGNLVYGNENTITSYDNEGVTTSVVSIIGRNNDVSATYINASNGYYFTQNVTNVSILGNNNEIKAHFDSNSNDIREDLSSVYILGDDNELLHVTRSLLSGTNNTASLTKDSSIIGNDNEIIDNYNSDGDDGYYVTNTTIIGNRNQGRDINDSQVMGNDIAFANITAMTLIGNNVTAMSTDMNGMNLMEEWLHDTVAIGNNITVEYINNVILGNSSTDEKFEIITGQQVTPSLYLNYAGTAVGTVSVGAEGAERQIVNVAPGDVSANSTDAINGSQLYAVVSNIQSTLDGWNEEFETGGWKLTIDERGGSAEGGSEETVSKDNVVTFIAGDNIKLVQNGLDITISTDATPIELSGENGITVTPVTNTDGDTTGYNIGLDADTQAQIAKEESVVAGSDNVVVTQTGTNDTGGKEFVVDIAKNLDLGTDGSVTMGDVTISGDNIDMGGNVITNVAGPVEGTDAANKDYVDNSRTLVTAGDGITVTKTEEGNQLSFEVALNESLTAQIAKEESVVAGSDNVVVTQTGTNDTGGKEFVVDIAKNLDLGTDGSVTMGDVVIAGNNIDMGGNVVSNVAAGVTDTDAVNVAQLKAAKMIVEAGDKITVSTTESDNGTVYTVSAATSEVQAGNNVQVSETQGDNGQSIYTVTVDGDLNDITSIANGDTKISLGDNVIDVNGSRIVNVATPTAANDAANKDYVDNSRTTVASADGSLTVTATVTNATTGATHYNVALSAENQAEINKIGQGINTTTDDGIKSNHQLGDTIAITGDGKNISTVTTSNGGVQVKLAENLQVSSAIVGNVTINNDGGISGVKAGDVSATSTDAVNGSQLYETNQQVKNIGNQVHNLDKRINRVQKEARAAAAGAHAAAALPQVRGNGKSMIAASAGTFKGESALAVGYSRASDNGKLLLKIHGSANTRGDIGAGIGMGYEW